MIGCVWDYFAVAHITSDKTQYEAKNCLFEMCEELKEGKQFMTIQKDGTILEPSEHWFLTISEQLDKLTEFEQNYEAVFKELDFEKHIHKYIQGEKQ